MLHWSYLMKRIRNAEGGHEPPLLAWHALVAFRVVGARPQHGFLRCGLPREQVDRAETWGPISPAEVDWAGF